MNKIEITEENLKWAFIKLKNYSRNENASNYLNIKILNLEKNYKNNKNIFKEIANDLNNLSLKNFSMLSNETVNTFLYPKKNSARISEENLTINDVNIFIDVDIKFFLVDILFCLYLLEEYPLIDDSLFFGHKINECLKGCESIVKNKYLFSKYWYNYKEWKSSIVKGIDDEALGVATLVKFDFKRCFYNTIFNMETFIRSYNLDANDPIVKISLNMYRLYSKKIFNAFGQNKKEQEVMLIVGFPSSNVIQNILYSNLDKVLNDASKGVLRYSRYVDDILMLINRSNYSWNDFSADFSNVINIENKKIYMNVNSDFLQRIEINPLKIELKNANDAVSIKKEVNRILNDYYVIDEEDQENINIRNRSFDDDSLSLKSIKKRIFTLRSNESLDEIIMFIRNLSSVERLNAYSIWRDIFSLIKNDSILLNDIFRLIYEDINKIQIVSDTQIMKQLTEELREHLFKELDYAKTLACDDTIYLYDISKDDLFNYIEKRDYEFFPKEISLEEIMIYISEKDIIKEDFIEESKKKFKELNGYEISENLRINKVLISKWNNSKISFTPFLECLGEKEKYTNILEFKYVPKDSEVLAEVYIGIASLKMPLSQLKDTDIANNYMPTYNFSDISNLIKEAKKNKAKYILFPEFSIPNKDVLKIIKVCKKNKISIIAGLTHKISGNNATNFVLVYDYHIGLAFLKPKNYYPYEEKYLLAKNGYYTKDITPGIYCIVDDGYLRYSTMTCFEATNIKDRAALSDEISTLFMPVYNKDTNYFSSIISSLTRDISSFVVQANNSEYGDSRITAPMRSDFMNMVQIKGGENSYVVVGKINFVSLKYKHDDMAEIDDLITKLPMSADKENDALIIDEKINKAKENNYKTYSAGTNIKKRKDNNLY